MKKTTRNTPRFRSIGYAYASSPAATRLGFGKTGCYLVAVRRAGCADKAIAGFETPAEAARYAHDLAPEIAWCPMFLRHMSAEVRAAFEACQPTVVAVSEEEMLARECKPCREVGARFCPHARREVR